MLIPKSAKTPTGFFIIMGIAVLCGLLSWAFGGLIRIPTVPLLAATPQMQAFSSLKDADRFVGHPIPMPTHTFGSDVHVIGVYPETENGIEKGTIVAVFVRDNVRFAEWSIHPGKTLAQEAAKHTGSTSDIVKLNGADATFLHFPETIVPCSKGKAPETVGQCRLTKEIIFEKDQNLYILAADGTHMTDGELLEMMRSVSF